MKKTELIQALMFLSSSYPGKLQYPCGDDVKDTALEGAWMVFLQKYSYESVMIIIKDLIPRKPVWPPTVGEIVNRLNEVGTPASEQTPPEESWERILKVAKATSKYTPDSEIFEKWNVPEIVRSTVRAVGGLESIRNSRREDPFFKKSYIDAYKTYSERSENQIEPQLRESIQAEIKKIAESKSSKLLNKGKQNG